MPTKEQMEAAIVDIDRTLTKYPGNPSLQFAQMQDHEWPGFCLDEQRIVIGRVLGFEPKDQWMTGLDQEMNVEEIRATPAWKRSMEFDAYWDAAPEREIEQWYDWVESQDAENNNSQIFEAEPQQVRPLTEQLIEAAHLDVWPSIAAIVDFGIDSESHLGALQFAIKYGEVTSQELDAAMGDGAKLTEIAQRGDNPYRDVTFRTSWDNLRLESEEQDASELFSEAPVQGAASEKLQFKKILHATTTPEVKQERGSKENEGREM